MIKINQLTFNYQKHKNIFEKLSLQIKSESFSLLAGPTGCGKSTLLKIIAGLYPQFGGHISHGKIENSFNHWGMVFQDPDKQFTMKTPYQEFIFSLENLQLTSQQAQIRIALATKETNTQDLLHRDFLTLSGGEKQRIALAIIIAMDSDLILLDEPFANCDPLNRKFLLNYLAKLKKAGKTIIITDHNLNGYEKICDQVFLFKTDKKIISLSSDQKRAFFQQQIFPKLTFTLPQNEKAILNFKDFSLSQGNKILITKQDLKIFEGHCTLLSGVNGAGKTSLFTVKEEIELSQKLSKKFTPVQIQKFLAELKLDNLTDESVYSLSGGQKKKLQILLMILANPDILLLDEPFAGLDTQSITKISDLLRTQFLTKDKTLIIISHQSDQLDLLCDYHLVLENQHLQYTTGGLKNESQS